MSQTKFQSSSQNEIDAYASYMHSHTHAEGSATRGAWLLAIGFGLYTLVVTVLAGAGFYSNVHPSLFALTVVASMTSLILAYFTVPSIRAFVERLGPYGLATFHAWRIGAALAFLYYASQGWLPDTFVNLAGWGDMLAGVLAVGLIVFRATKNRIVGFHMIGMTDFVVAVGTGLTLQLLADPLMANIVYLPIAFIPLVGVPLSGASHIVAFHLLWKERRDNAKG